MRATTTFYLLGFAQGMIAAWGGSQIAKGHTAFGLALCVLSFGISWVGSRYADCRRDGEDAK